jgi:hypothetical protein
MKKSLCHRERERGDLFQSIAAYIESGVESVLATLRRCRLTSAYAKTLPPPRSTPLYEAKPKTALEVVLYGLVTSPDTTAVAC